MAKDRRGHGSEKRGGKGYRNTRAGVDRAIRSVINNDLSSWGAEDTALKMGRKGESHGKKHGAGKHRKKIL